DVTQSFARETGRLRATKASRSEAYARRCLDEAVCCARQSDSDGWQDQVLVKRRFQDTGVRSSKHGPAALNVVCDAEARLGFFVSGQAVVEISAQSHIE